GRQRNEHCRDLSAFEGRGIVREVPGAGVTGRGGDRAIAVAAGVETFQVGRNRAQRLRMQVGGGTGAENRDRTGHSRPAMCVPVRSALAAIVSDGLTPPDRGSALPSVTNRFSRPRKPPRSSSGERRGSTPSLTVPT